MCNGKSMHLCPVSFGLALGVTSAIAIFIWSLWMMYHGVPPMMEAFHLAPMTWLGTLVYTLIGLLKGFLFGFFLALFYDMFACCLRGKCRKSEGTTGGCGCGCSGCKCGMDKSPEIKA